MAPSIGVHLCEAPSTCPSHRTLCGERTHSTTPAVESMPPTKGSAQIPPLVGRALWQLQSPADANAIEILAGTNEIANKLECSSTSYVFHQRSCK